MSAAASVSPQLLIVEAEPALRLLLQQALAEMGYASTLASSLEQALRLLQQQPFDLIITDAFFRTDQDTLAFLHPLLALSHPLPVVLCTAWPLSAPAVRQTGFAGLVRQPCDLHHLVTTVAECLNQSWSPAQLRQAEVVKRYIAGLLQGDVEAILALCTEEVRLYPWMVPAYPFARPVTGRAAARAYLQEQQRYFGAYQLEQIHYYPCPHGVALRLLMHWQDAAGAVKQQMVAGCIKVTPAGQISQVGLPPPDALVRAITRLLKC